jgi:hypothetical protein
MRRPRRSTILKTAISLALVVFLFACRPLTWSALRTAVAAPQWPWLALSGGVFALSAVCGALQWAWILRCSGLRVTVGEAVRLSFVGLFFNNFLLGSVGGDAYKVVDLGRREGRTAAVLGATLLDRLLGLLALTLLALLAVPTAVAAGVRVPPTLPLWLALAAWSLAFAVLFSRRASALAVRALTAARWRRAADGLGTMLAEFKSYRRRPAWLARLLVWSLFVQAMRVSTHLLVGLGLGLALDTGRVLQLFVLVPLLGILVSLPVSINGLGVRELAAAELFVSVGVVPTEADAVAMEFLAYALMVAVSLVGGALFLAGPRRRRGAA